MKRKYTIENKLSIKNNAVYTTAEVASLLQMSDRNIRRLVDDKKLYCVRPYSPRMFLGQHLLNFMNSDVRKDAEKAYHKGFYEGLRKIQTVYKLDNIQFRAKIDDEYIYSGTDYTSVIKFWCRVKDTEIDGEIEVIELINKPSTLSEQVEIVKE